MSAIPVDQIPEIGRSAARYLIDGLREDMSAPIRAALLLDPSYLESAIDEFEAAKFLNTKVSTLRTWRSRPPPGGGPPFIRISGRHIKYRRSDLIQFLSARRVTGERETTPES